MSLLSLAFPVEAALPAAEALAGTALAAARPLLGFGALAALLVVFKPLLVGLLRAALLVLKPRQSFEERFECQTMQGVLTLHRMARELDGIEPSLAAELRSIASRG